MATWYVNTDATGGTYDGTTVETGYQTLAAAIAAKLGVLSEPCIFDCRGVAADTAAVNTAGFTTSAANYVEIRVTQANRHDGKWNTSKYRLVSAASSLGTFRMATDYIRVDGLQIHGDATSANNDTVMYPAEGVDVRISNCIIRSAGNASYDELTVRIGSCPVAIWNCVAYGSSAHAWSAGLFTSGTVSAYSCVFISGAYGVLVNGGVTTAKNCYANTFYVNTGTLTQTNCAASDTTADGTDPHDSVACNIDTFVNVSAGTEDFHLAADGLSPLQGHGVDTTGDAAPLNFTTDIDGQTIGASWSIGADNIAGSGLSVFVYESTIVDEFNG